MSDINVEDTQQQPVATRTRRLSGHVNSPTDSSFQACTLEEITKAYEKNAEERTQEELRILEEYSFLIPEVEAGIKNRQAKEILRQRFMELEESPSDIGHKVDILVKLIREAKHVVIYTGAGISTSASIPDYRGPNGLWTQIKRTGRFSITKIHDLTHAEPTLTHMAIKELCRRRVVKHVVSQNCDGLHLRSGIPQSHLSEIHGNMYIEVCPTCEKQYFRQADVTERTSRFRHKTGRKCHTCADPNNNLVDTIVLYGERSRTKWPMNWERASKAAKRADLIICMGSSLKTLRRYSCLWPKGISSSKKDPETKLAIINLQYTPKDKNAVLKINGKCDFVMQLVMRKLNINIPPYEWTDDPLIKLAIPFTQEERDSLKKNLLFEVRQSSTSPSTSLSMKGPKSESRCSPSIFVSELTDDPDTKKLKMRIRAVNIYPTEQMANDPEIENDATEEMVEYEGETENSGASKVKIECTLPGWLGKSLGSTKSSSYRRKRHCNKGRK